MIIVDIFWRKERGCLTKRGQGRIKIRIALHQDEGHQFKMLEIKQDYVSFYKDIKQVVIFLCGGHMNLSFQFFLSLKPGIRSKDRFKLCNQIFDISSMENPKEQLLAEIKAIAAGNFDKYNKYLSSPDWLQNGKVKGEKVCMMYKMGVDSRVASMGVVNNVEGTLEEFSQMLSDQPFFFLLDPQMIEFKELLNVVKSPKDIINVNYIRFKGIGPISDRDFVLAERYIWTENKFYVVSSSCNYPFPEVKGVVRGDAIIGGYVAEKIDEKTLKVTYLSDGDIKGSIPGFVKNLVSQSQGEIASRVNECLKKFRLKNKK